MNCFIKYNILHIIVFLLLNYIGLYVIPSLFHDHMACFIATPIYFTIVNLLIIYWTLNYGITEKENFKQKIRQLLDFNDYLLIAFLFIGSFAVSIFMAVIENHHLFNFLTINFQKSVITPPVSTVKEFKTLVTFLLLFSTLVMIISEELFFRAYLFEKQFLYMRNLTWILNGLFWTTYHLFAKSNLIELLPIALLFSLVYQKRRNVTITFIAHVMINFVSVSRLIFPLY